MKNTTLKNKIAKGFSLVEMLVVIAVIGVIAAIAIPNIGSINASATTAKNQRNAQSIVSVFQAGAAAGVAWSGATAAALVTDVVTGRAPASGAFSGKTFKVPGISADEQTAALTKITLVGTELVYTP
jgi:type IV pilus assembly protein PilA